MPSNTTRRDEAWIAVLNAFAYERLVTIDEILAREDLPEERRSTVRGVLRALREHGLVEQQYHGVYQLTDPAVELLQDVLEERLKVWQ